MKKRLGIMSIFYGKKSLLMVKSTVLITQVMVISSMCFTVVQSQPLKSERKPISREDLQNLKGVSGLNISPDGAMIVFRQSGNILLRSTKKQSVVKKVGTGFSPTWSPDGNSIAFVSVDKKTGKPQIYQYRLKENQTSQLTNLTDGIISDSPDWSSTNKLVFTAQVAIEINPTESQSTDSSNKAGTPFVFTNLTPDGAAANGLLPGTPPPDSQADSQVKRPSNELFIYDFATNKTKQLTKDVADYFSPQWSPDGASIVCLSKEAGDKRNFVRGVYLIDAIKGSRTIVAHTGDTAKLHPSWSPNGREIAYVFHSFTDSQNHGIAITSIGERGKVGDTKILISQLVEEFTWAPDGKAIYATVQNKSFLPLIRVDTQTKKYSVAGSSEAAAYNITSSRSGALVWQESRGNVPVVIRFLDSNRTISEEIHDPNPEVKSWKLGKQEVIRWQNRFGHQRSGILIKPAGYEPGKRYPLVVSAYSQGTHTNSFQKNTHGGFANQEFASKGYMVFFPGPRLPWMYGSLVDSSNEAKEVKGAKGWDVTVDDVESGVDLLIKRGIVDAKRMAIVGHSNGGAAATAVITRTTRFRAAVIVAPANINWIDKGLYDDNTMGRFIPHKTFIGVSKGIYRRIRRLILMVRLCCRQA